MDQGTGSECILLTFQVLSTLPLLTLGVHAQGGYGTCFVSMMTQCEPVCSDIENPGLKLNCRSIVEMEVLAKKN